MRKPLTGIRVLPSEVRYPRRTVTKGVGLNLHDMTGQERFGNRRMEKTPGSHSGCHICNDALSLRSLGPTLSPELTIVSFKFLCWASENNSNMGLDRSSVTQSLSSIACCWPRQGWYDDGRSSSVFTLGTFSKATSTS